MPEAGGGIRVFLLSEKEALLRFLLQYTNPFPTSSLVLFRISDLKSLADAGPSEKERHTVKHISKMYFSPPLFARLFSLRNLATCVDLRPTSCVGRPPRVTPSSARSPRAISGVTGVPWLIDGESNNNNVAGRICSFQKYCPT